GGGDHTHATRARGSRLQQYGAGGVGSRQAHRSRILLLKRNIPDDSAAATPYLCPGRHMRTHMEPVTLENLQKSVGKEIGLSPWREVTQKMIDLFADATDDHQFIHCDP